jgi:hypothetical protein
MIIANTIVSILRAMIAGLRIAISCDTYPWRSEQEGHEHQAATSNAHRFLGFR